MSYNDDKLGFYAVLDLDRDASMADIRSAYLKLSLKCHPDKAGLSSIASHEKFVQLNEAYKTLGDSSRRQNYDKQLPPRTNRESKKNAKPANMQQESEVPQPDNPRRRAETERKDLEMPLSGLWDAYDRLRRLLMPEFMSFIHNQRLDKYESCVYTLSALDMEMYNKRHNWDSIKFKFSIYEMNMRIPSYSELNLEYSRLKRWITATKQGVENIIRLLESWQASNEPLTSYKIDILEREFDTFMNQYLHQYKRDSR